MYRAHKNIVVAAAVADIILSELKIFLLANHV